VETVTGVLLAFSSVRSSPYFMQIGIDPSGLDAFDLPLLEGRRLAPNAPDEIMLAAARHSTAR
jgi:hypothetical protein